MTYVLIGSVLVALLALAFVLWQRAELDRFQVVTQEVEVEESHFTAENPRTVRAVVLADLHNHVYGENNERLIKAIDDVKPDFVIVSGDLMIAKPGRDFDQALSLLERLSEKYEIYYGLGNHEYRYKIYPDKYPGMYDKLTKALDRFGVHYLDNVSEELSVGGMRFSITGVTIDRAYYVRLKKVVMEKTYLDSIIGKPRKDCFCVLIAHNPEYFENYASWGADLVLSGHVHGGMVRLPLLGGVISPKIQLFPKYDGGRFALGKSQMLLSRGLGMHTIPIRVWNRAELTEVRFVPRGKADVGVTREKR